MSAAGENKTADPIGDKELLGSLEFLSNTHRQLHNQRRQYEHKVSLTTLTFYVLSVGATYTGQFTLQSHPVFYGGTVIVFFALACFSIGMLWRIHQANWINIQSAEHFETKIVEIIKKRYSGITPPGWNPNRKPDRHHFIWQSATILLFALTAIVLILFSGAATVL